MSAFWLVCTRCGTSYIGGVVGSTPWPPHVCPDGTENAPAEFTNPPQAARTGEAIDPS